jgi:hypothetical protein
MESDEDVALQSGEAQSPATTPAIVRRLKTPLAEHSLGGDGVLQKSIAAAKLRSKNVLIQIFITKLSLKIVTSAQFNKVGHLLIDSS